MAVIKFILLAVEVIAGLLLIAAILLQRTKDQGLGLAFGSGMGEALFGARTGNVLTKVTIILAVVFFLDSVILARIFSAAGGTGSVLDGVSVPTAPVAPGGGAAPDGAPPPAQPSGEMPTIPSGNDAETPVVDTPAMPEDVPVAVPGAVETTVPTVPAPVDTPADMSTVIPTE